MSRTTSRNNFVTDLSSTQTYHLLYSPSGEMYTTTTLITTSIILTDNSTSDMKTIVDSSSSQKSLTVTDQDSTSINMYTIIISLISLNTVMKLTSSIITSIVSTSLYNDITVHFTTNNITLIISISLVILLIISMLSCSVIVVIVIIKRRKTYKTNNSK